MNILIFIFLSLISFSSFSQHQTPAQGTVYLKNGQQITGEVLINFELNVTETVNEKNQKIINHSSMIDSVNTVNDCELSRSYRVFPFDNELHLFQLITRGKIKLLRKVVHYESFNSNTVYNINHFYFLNSNNKIKVLKKFKKQILPLMKNKKTELKEFAQANDIGKLKRVKNTNHIFLLISFYNTLIR